MKRLNIHNGTPACDVSEVVLTRALQITSGTKTLIISINGARFMARTLYEEGACHDFVRQDVI